MASGHGTRAVVAALLANLGIAVAKFVGFLVTGSSALLAESVHSGADSGNQGLLLLGIKRARRDASSTHPFGYARARYVWSFVVALMLFVLGSLFSLYEGAQKLRHPHELVSPLVAVGILVAAIGLETWSFRTAIREANALRSGRSWWAFIRGTKQPEVPVVLLEDLGALVGMVLALVGVGLAIVTGDARFDALGTLAIGVLLGVIAGLLAWEMHSLLIGEAAAAEDTAAIIAAMESEPGVRRLLEVKTQHLGPDELLVAAKVELDPNLTFAQVVEVIDAAERRVREDVPEATALYVEPDVGVAGGRGSD